MNEVDIGLFQFDWDLTWAGMFLNASDRIYSRYGGRDAQSAEGRLSVAGLKYTMRHVLQYHKQQSSSATATTRRPTLPGDWFTVKGNGCLHCHQVWEGLRKRLRQEGRFSPDMLYVYPLPENVGLQLDVTAGNKVIAVTPNSPAQRAGIQAGDVIDSIHNVKIFAQGDVMWALHNAPAEGKVTVRYMRGSNAQTATLELTRGWKRTDLSWRPSMRKEKK